MENITVDAGTAKVTFTCTVTNIGGHKVSNNYIRQVIETFYHLTTYLITIIKFFRLNGFTMEDTFAMVFSKREKMYH